MLECSLRYIELLMIQACLKKEQRLTLEYAYQSL